MPPNAVVDVSVLVSAFLFPDSLPGRVVALAADRAFVMHFSTILLEEVKRSLRNPKLRASYGHTDQAIDAWCAGLHHTGQLIASPLPEIGPVCRDPDDDHVIAAAIAVDAGWIVTGDRDLLDLGRHLTIRIVTPRTFLDELDF